jgi:putative endonuclease
VSTTSGQIAEDKAAEYLVEKGFKIIDRNWRRPSCEIDIVASKKEGFRKPKVIYFFEVKYRRRKEQGSGIDYITPKKLDQMKFAAKVWTSENRYNGEYELGAVELTGPDYNVTLFLPNLDV